MKRIFISEAPVQELSRAGNQDYHLAVHVNSASSNENLVFDESTNKNKVEKTFNVSFSVKAIPAVKLADTSYEDIYNHQNSYDSSKVMVKSQNEQYALSLKDIPVPSVILKNFENSEDLQDFLEGYYLQSALNANKDYGVQNWIEKK